MESKIVFFILLPICIALWAIVFDLLYKIYKLRN